MGFVPEHVPEHVLVLLKPVVSVLKSSSVGVNLVLVLYGLGIPLTPIDIPFSDCSSRSDI